MKILIITYHYPPEISGGTARTTLLEKHLVSRGDDLTIITPQDISAGFYGARVIPAIPWYRKLRRSRPDDPQTLSSEVNTLKTMAVAVAGAFLLPDQIRLWTPCAVSKAVELIDSVDFLITTSPPESVHMVGLKLKQVAKKKFTWLADLRDGWMRDSLRPQTKWPIRKTLEGGLESKVFHDADYVSFVSQITLEDASARYPELTGKFRYFPTGFDKFHSSSKPRDDRRLNIVYTGRIGLSRSTQNPRLFFDALERLVNENPEIAQTIHVDFFGLYAQTEMEMAKGLTERKIVRFHKPVAPSSVPDILCKADALLLFSSTQAKTVVPRKLFEYLGAGRPIFAIAHGCEAARIIEETQTGWLVKPEIRAITNALKELWTEWKSGGLAGMGEPAAIRKYLSSSLIEELLSSISL